MVYGVRVKVSSWYFWSAKTLEPLVSKKMVPDWFQRHQTMPITFHTHKYIYIYIYMNEHIYTLLYNPFSHVEPCSNVRSHSARSVNGVASSAGSKTFLRARAFGSTSVMLETKNRGIPSGSLW